MVGINAVGSLAYCERHVLLLFSFCFLPLQQVKRSAYRLSIHTKPRAYLYPVATPHNQLLGMLSPLLKKRLHVNVRGCVHVCILCNRLFSLLQSPPQVFSGLVGETNPIDIARVIPAVILAPVPAPSSLNPHSICPSTNGQVPCHTAALSSLAYA
jgi:hypothetical protein